MKVKTLSQRKLKASQDNYPDALLSGLTGKIRTAKES